MMTHARQSANRARSRGLASFIAVASIAAVGLAMATLGTTFAWQARRTKHHAAEAQLRQLLLASAVHVEASLDADRPGQIPPMHLPPALQDAAVTFEIAPLPSDRMAVTITASWKQHHAQQMLTLRGFEDGWHLVDASLVRPR